ncbi:MAG TPA: hypothetical protein VKU41_27075, partial [Polyangiaceae bacterium]|nr:hypothetical protein [Polyangiaceae bacterium]
MFFFVSLAHVPAPQLASPEAGAFFAGFWAVFLGTTGALGAEGAGSAAGVAVADGAVVDAAVVDGAA